MPALFIGHGSPMNALVTNRWTEDWKALGASLPRPRAIVAISAHWYTDGTGVTAVSTPRTIHDFGGFPRELFEVQYPAPGDPDLAKDLTEILARTRSSACRRPTTTTRFSTRWAPAAKGTR